MAAPSAPLKSSAKLIDPGTLMRIRSLELRARAVVQGFWSGIHRSPYHGFSSEFTEYRQYSVGDDPRYLDWRVYGRSDRYFIKKFEDETNLRFQLVVDQSRSMTFGSAGYTKAEYAATLAATLAYFVYQQGDAVGLLTFDAELRDMLPVRHRTGHLRRIFGALERPAAGTGTDFVLPLQQLAGALRRRGMVVVISDFLAPLEPWERHLATLTAVGHEVVLFQVLDPRELSFDFRDAVVFEDLESGQKMYVDPAAVRERYQRALAAHGSALRGVAERLGAAGGALEGVLQHAGEGRAAQLCVELDAGAHQHLGAQRLEQGVDNEQADHDRRDQHQGHHIPAAEHPVVDLQHVERTDQRQQVDEQAEDRRRHDRGAHVREGAIERRGSFYRLG